MGHKYLKNLSHGPLVSEEDPAWRATVRDADNPIYIAWLEGPHNLVIQELQKLKFVSYFLEQDIELHGALKALMQAGWQHGPYVHDPTKRKVEWQRKWTLKQQTQGDGRVVLDG